MTQNPRPDSCQYSIKVDYLIKLYLYMYTRFIIILFGILAATRYGNVKNTHSEMKVQFILVL